MGFTEEKLCTGKKVMLRPRLFSPILVVRRGSFEKFLEAFAKIFGIVKAYSVSDLGNG